MKITSYIFAMESLTPLKGKVYIAHSDGPSMFIGIIQQSPIDGDIVYTDADFRPLSHLLKFTDLPRADAIHGTTHMIGFMSKLATSFIGHAGEFSSISALEIKNLDSVLSGFDVYSVHPLTAYVTYHSEYKKKGNVKMETGPLSDDDIRLFIKRSVARNILKGMSIEEAFKSVDILFEYFKYLIRDLDPIDAPDEEAKLNEAMKQISDEQIDKFMESRKNKNSVRSCANCPNLINGKFEAYGDVKNIVTCSRFGFWTFSGSIQDFTACDAIDRLVKKIADSTTKRRRKQRIHCGMCIHFTKIGNGRRCMGRCDLIGDRPCCSSSFNDTENNAPKCREFKRRKEQTK